MSKNSCKKRRRKEKEEEEDETAVTPILPVDCMREITSFIRDDESLAIVSATCRDFRALALAQREFLADPAHIFDFRLDESDVVVETKTGLRDAVVDTGSSKSDMKAVLLGGMEPEGNGPPSDEATLSPEGLVCDGGADDLFMFSEDDGEIYDLTGGHAMIDTPIKFGGSLSVEIYYKRNVINPIKRYLDRHNSNNDAVVFDFDFQKYDDDESSSQHHRSRHDSIRFLDCAGKMDLQVKYGSDKKTKVEVAEGEFHTEAWGGNERFRFFRTDYDYATKNTTIAREMGSDLNKWVHVVITVSGTTAKIFKNGKLVVTNDDGAFSDHPLTLNGTLCAQYRYNHASNALNGTLAYMKIWPRFDLKESDVAALYSRRNST
ncbi:hypothetical protein TrCOL_g11573 [Triparma columacea]|uniref:F-box domain-containing protein n=1 Tax=Triparma columacea TaxID=722753 RepID=A0A9W7G2Q7_9STRA|nr:hypothetical protein TrCOL_g11573 [Triparma columacea]